MLATPRCDRKVPREVRLFGAATKALSIDRAPAARGLGPQERAYVLAKLWSASPSRRMVTHSVRARAPSDS